MLTCAAAHIVTLEHLDLRAPITSWVMGAAREYAPHNEQVQSPQRRQYGGLLAEGGAWLMAWRPLTLHPKQTQPWKGV